MNIHPLVIGALLLVAFALGMLVMLKAGEAGNIAREDEQRCVKVILEVYSADKAKCQALIDELHGFANDENIKLWHLSDDLREVYHSVMGK